MLKDKAKYFEQSLEFKGFTASEGGIQILKTGTPSHLKRTVLKKVKRPGKIASLLLFITASASAGLSKQKSTNSHQSPQMLRILPNGGELLPNFGDLALKEYVQVDDNIGAYGALTNAVLNETRSQNGHK